jgi:hypothetical protein
MTVNLTYKPYFEVEARKYRFHLNARRVALFLALSAARR